MAAWHSPLAERSAGAPPASTARPEGGALHLADLSATARRAYRGADAGAYLAARDLPVPEAGNTAKALPASAGVAARLGPAELWLVAPPGQAAVPETWPAGADPNDGDAPMAYATDRTNSHAQFALTGHEAPGCLAKLCGVDLRPQAFGALAVAQSSVARVAAVILRADRADGTLAYQLFVDRASAAYFWDCLVDAGAEYGLTVAAGWR